MSDKPSQKEQELLKTCLENSGEYVPTGHPSTSFATTYSHRFIKAAAELYEIYRKQDPRPHKATTKLWAALRDAKVPACRGGYMTFDKAEYLVKRRILPYLRNK